MKKNKLCPLCGKFVRNGYYRRAQKKLHKATAGVA